MSDTLRALPVLLSLFPDNHSGLIVPQGMRDLVISGPIRGPSEWLYKIGASPIDGQVSLGAGNVIHVAAVDADGVDRSIALGALAQAGSFVRLVNVANGSCLGARIITVAVAGPVWNLEYQALAAAGTFNVNDLVALGFLALQPGSTPGTTFTAANMEAFSILPGLAVASHSSGSGVVLASAAGAGGEAIGLQQDNPSPAANGVVQTGGLFYAGDWSAVTGTATLQARGLYFLDPATPGRLTTTPPTTPGQILQIVGVAVSPQLFALQLGVPFLL